MSINLIRKVNIIGEVSVVNILVHLSYMNISNMDRDNEVISFIIISGSNKEVKNSGLLLFFVLLLLVLCLLYRAFLVSRGVYCHLLNKGQLILWILFIIIYVWFSIAGRFYNIVYLNTNQMNQISKIGFHHLLITEHKNWLWCHVFTTQNIPGTVKISNKTITGIPVNQYLKTDIVYKMPITRLLDGTLIYTSNGEEYIKEFFENIENESNLKDAIENEEQLTIPINYKIVNFK